jgi:hypothetical protein
VIDPSFRGFVGSERSTFGVTTIQDSAATAIGLALGQPGEPVHRVDWSQVLVVASAERIAVLGWLRSGEFIRGAAPSGIVSSWRALAIHADELAHVQWSAACELSSRLEDDGISAVVLKGIPLASRLYGYAGARVSCDIDLYIPSGQRAKAAHVIRTSGWQWWAGEEPWDVSYLRADGGRTLYLEVHSSLLGEALAHCGPLGIESERWEFGGSFSSAMSGETLPAYLAANVVKHVHVPVISYFDLATLWGSLGDDGRRNAIAVARSARLYRYMAWAIQKADGLIDACRGDGPTIRGYGIVKGEKRALHGHVRLMSLADSPIDAARVLGSWVWPRPTRKSLVQTSRFWARRVRGPLVERLAPRRGYALAGRTKRPGQHS